MDHAEATGRGAAERYLLGQLEDEERDRYEEHFFGCPECADEVKAGALFLETAKSVVERPPAGARHRSEPSRRGGWRAHFVPMPVGAAAALVVLLAGGAYQGLVVLPGLRGELREAEGIQAAPQYFLSISRGQPAVIRPGRRQRVVGVTLSRSSERSFPTYRIELRNAAGDASLTAAIPAPAEGEELQLMLPIDGLPAGEYELAVAGVESSSGARPASEPARYRFILEREEKGVGAK